MTDLIDRIIALEEAHKHLNAWREVRLEIEAVVQKQMHFLVEQLQEAKAELKALKERMPQ